MRDVMTTGTERNNIRGFSEEGLGREDRNAELNWKELESDEMAKVSGGNLYQAACKGTHIPEVVIEVW